MNRKGLLQSGAFLVWVFVLAVAAPAQQEDAYRGLRAGLIEEIRADVKLTSERIGRARLTDRVLQAMLKVPRHEFVPDRLRPYAYENRPLPIGFGQTISQPYIVAVMTDLMDASEDATVLEVGTGSGYQAAVLAECVKQVYSIEIIEELGREAAERLERLGYRNVEVRTGDGYYGWKEKAPFDAIMVTAAASHIPPPLIEQLKPGGRMIIPIGSAFMTQHLMLVEKDPGSKIKTRQLLPVAFVPLTGGH
ncbi:MAG: protein-L-isoaspartate(D-aspartate) O-methyltransferase [Syntrophobacteraceae bacterium]|nr:protein-L-isoaspartate(D-aspartate) O-methyltransferase [Syntrophobacteraceae bacterium]